MCPEPLLYMLLTYDCSARYPSNHIVKFADDTVTPVYRQEVEELVDWCRANNLCINMGKTKEMVVDFRRRGHIPPPLFIGGAAVEMVSTFKYLDLHISNDLTWATNTASIIRKAH
ncbi:hypothetical protein LDENG_00080190 [Lucifuga dentata]|nr:hypothetical protein LDENG_00080190 [Lucifuga dentata]